MARESRLRRIIRSLRRPRRGDGAPEFGIKLPSDRLEIDAFLWDNRELLREVEEFYSECIGDTKPCDRQKAERSICALHDAIGVERPQTFLWLDYSVDYQEI
jgi:hypothetical protein